MHCFERPQAILVMGKDTDAVNCVDVCYHIAICTFVFQEESTEVGVGCASSVL